MKKKYIPHEQKLKYAEAFLKSGQTRKVWAAENNVALSSLGKYIDLYRKQYTVQFVPLSKEEPAKETKVLNKIEEKLILVEIGDCKFHLSEELSVKLIAQAMKGGTDHV